MHRHRILAQILLILSILNLVLAAPVVVKEMHEARADDMVVADVAAMPKKSGELEVASDKSTSVAGTSPPPSPDAMPSTQHSSLSDELMSSGHPSAHLSSTTSISGYSWMLDRLPRLSPNHPGLSHGSASPHPPNLGSPEVPLPAFHDELAATPSGSIGSVSTPSWLREMMDQIDLASSHQGSEWRLPSTPGNSPPERWTPSHIPSSSTFTNPFSLHSHESMSTAFASASGGSLTSHYFTASDGLPSRPSSPPENAKVVDESMMKKLKIVAGLVVVGTIVGGIAGSQIKHRDHQNS
jgi:hypothetical protein